MNIYRGMVGVAPGTTTMQLGYLNPYSDVIQMSGLGFKLPPPGKSTIFSSQVIRGVKDGVKKALHLTGPVDTRARIRWDLIGLIGGGSFVIAMTAGLLASALR